MKAKEANRKKYLKKKSVLMKEREAQGITISEMAAELGINRNAYAAKEKGKYPICDYEMRVIANKLNLPIEYLFFTK